VVEVDLMRAMEATLAGHPVGKLEVLRKALGGLE